jgi:hypothetical protein
MICRIIEILANTSHHYYCICISHFRMLKGAVIRNSEFSSNMYYSFQNHFSQFCPLNALLQAFPPNGSKIFRLSRGGEPADGHSVSPAASQQMSPATAAVRRPWDQPAPAPPDYYFSAHFSFSAVPFWLLHDLLHPIIHPFAALPLLCFLPPLPADQRKKVDRQRRRAYFRFERAPEEGSSSEDQPNGRPPAIGNGRQPPLDFAASRLPIFLLFSCCFPCLAGLELWI